MYLPHKTGYIINNSNNISIYFCIWVTRSFHYSNKVIKYEIICVYTDNNIG